MRKYLAIIGILAFTAGAYAQTSKLPVYGVRTGTTGDGVRVVLDLGTKADFRAFVIDKPYRLVLDLPTVEWNGMSSGILGGEVLKAWRSGARNDGVTRLIFDMKKPAIVSRAFTIPKEGSARDRLVVDLKPVSPNVFAARMGDVAGKLKVAAAPADDHVLKLKPPSSTTATAPAAPISNRKYVVVVDAGHGGGDPGAEASGVTEKYLTLSAARALRDTLEETGRYKVVLTRDRDTYIKLHERVDISRRVKGDLFISLHADKIDRKGIRGASIYTLSEKGSDSETERLAESENKAGFVAGVDLDQESEDVADILLDLAMREKMNESNMFARMLKGALNRAEVRLLPNSHRSAGFAVLKAPDVPSVLIEMGFVSNPEEAKLLSSSQFQRGLASAITEGVDAYFRKIQALQKR